jgi:hypothetical protein
MIMLLELLSWVVRSSLRLSHHNLNRWRHHANADKHRAQPNKADHRLLDHRRSICLGNDIAVLAITICPVENCSSAAEQIADSWMSASTT